MRRLVSSIKNIQIFLSGKVYSAKDLDYSEQYLGTGETPQEALDNMKDNIIKHSLKKKEKNV